MSKYFVFKTIMGIFLGLSLTLSASRAFSEIGNYHREIVMENGAQVYIVTLRATHLFMISRDLYGSDKYWKQIARWNHIKAPYGVSVGQHLILKKAPTQSVKDGDQALVKAWIHADKWDTAIGIILTRSSGGKEIATSDESSAAAVPVSETAEKAPVVEKAPPLSPDTDPALAPPEVASPKMQATAVPSAESQAPQSSSAQFQALLHPGPAAPPIQGATVTPPPPAMPPAPAPLSGQEPTAQKANELTPGIEAYLAATPGTESNVNPAPKHREHSREKNRENGAAETNESRWELSASALASIFRLESNYASSNVHNILYSDIDYGAEVEVGFHLNSKFEFNLGAGVEKMDIKPADGGLDIAGDSQYLWRFALGAGYQVLKPLLIKLSFIYEQDPYCRPTIDGTAIDALYIPQILLGDRLRFLHIGGFAANLDTDVLVTLPTNKDTYSVKTNPGAIVGLAFENELSEAFRFTYGVSARYLQQNTTTATGNQKAGFVNLGFTYGF